MGAANAADATSSGPAPVPAFGIPEGRCISKPHARFLFGVLELECVGDQTWDDSLPQSVVVAVVIAKPIGLR